MLKSSMSFRLSAPLGLVLNLVVLLLSVAPAHAQYVAQAPDAILISNSLSSVTRREYDSELTKLPADMREGFSNSPKRVNDLLVRLLVQKSLAVQARAAKLDASPDTAARIALEIDRLLAGFEVEAVERAAGAEFDSNIARYETRARELYLVDKASFTSPPEASASHILFETRKAHTSVEARRLAEETRAKILAGADFAKLAAELSDDPATGKAGGQLGWFSEKQMDPAFGAAAFALQKPGDVSKPVQSTYGWHIIRLDGKRPGKVQEYAEAREKILADMRTKFVDQRREAAIGAIRNDPKTVVNQEAVDALIPKVDRDAVRRAQEAAQPNAATPPK